MQKEKEEERSTMFFKTENTQLSVWYEYVFLRGRKKCVLYVAKLKIWLS